MNAIAPVLQFQRSSDAGQFKPGAAEDSSGNSSSSQDFTSAMHVASSKPTRKSATARTTDHSQNGNSSPASGKRTPAALPPHATSCAAASNAASNAGNANPRSGPAAAVAANANPALAPGPQPVAGTQNAEPPPTGVAAAGEAATGVAAMPFAQLIDQAAATAPTTAAANTSPPDSAVPPAAVDPTAAGDVATAGRPRATNGSETIRLAQTALLAGSAAPPPSKVAAAVTADVTVHTARANDAGGITLGAAAGTSGGDSTSATDAAAQTVMAAAAASRAADRPNSDGRAAPNFFGAPDTMKLGDGSGAGAAPPGAAVPGAAASAGLPPMAAVAAGSHLAEVQAVAVAASNARAITALAGVSVEAGDKPSHGNSADLSTSATFNDGGAGAAQMLVGVSSTDTTSTPTFKIPAPIETSDFSQGVADRVSFMVDGNISSARLHVNPPALGPIEVRIALQGAHAQVSFTSHSALTRDALESSAPKLREMLGAQGFGQVSVDVSQGGSFQDRAAQSSPYQAVATVASDSGSTTARTQPLTAPRPGTGALDAYA